MNLVAGAIQIRVRDFLLATLVGMSPGILAVVVLGNQLQRALQDPGIGNITLLMGLAIFFALLGDGVLPLVWERHLCAHQAKDCEAKNLAYCSFYNIHQCVGTDGKCDPQRIAAVIQDTKADIIGLQEVDLNPLGAKNPTNSTIWQRRPE